MMTLFAEKSRDGLLTGDYVFRDAPPMKYLAWTEYGTVEEFEADLEIDQQERHNNLHRHEEE